MKKLYSLTFLLLFFMMGVNAQVVINEVYGGGGNTGSTYKNDFIELYNNGNAPVSLAGWSIQYASATGSTWSVTNLSGSIPAKGFYLIQQAAGAGGTTNLPTPDAIGSIALSGTAGKVALVNSTTPLTGTCPASTAYVDLVGFGPSANCFRGAPTAILSNTTSAQRKVDGADSQNNFNDFKVDFPTPKNSSGGDITPPAVSSFSPSNNASGVNPSFTASINFDETIVIGTGNITLKAVSDNSVIATWNVTSGDVTATGSSATFAVSGLNLNTAYYFEIASGAFKDLAGNNYAGTSSSSDWRFTTSVGLPMGTIGVTYDLETCISSIPNGFSAFSVTGNEVWACTTFGRDPANPAGTAAFGHGVQINGYSGGTNRVNEDWFISPGYDLTSTQYPLLSFWSRTAFNGAPLQLKVSTDYAGTGDPSLATWADVNGYFPSQASNIWTLSQNINLSAFKSAKTYFAFVYTSTLDDGARWTLDDIKVENSATPPPASLTVNTNSLQFGYVAEGTSSIKNFTFTANDIIGNVTLTAEGAYRISKTPNNFSSSISYTQAEANNVSQTVYIQFSPLTKNLNYSGKVTIQTNSVTPDKVVSLSGNTINTDLTLEVVNWNIEWFGSSDPAFGPKDKTLQETNIKKISTNIAADVYAFSEVVSVPALARVVDTLNAVYGPGAYSYVVSDFGSHTNPFESGHGNINDAQKLGFVYKNSVLSNVSTSALVTDGVNTAADLANPAYNYFSSGRYPYMMKADVTLGGVTKMVRFVLIHAKANTSPTNISYQRRKNGADTLNYTLNTLYPDDNIILLGDFNDDLDQSITAGFTVSSYEIFNIDSANFFSPTLALSLAGDQSTVNYSDMIDHVELSNEMRYYYMQNSAAVLKDVATLVSNYGSTTSDHYPVFTRYAFDSKILPITLTSFVASKQGDAAVLKWETQSELNNKSFTVEKSNDQKNWKEVAVVNSKGAGNHSYSVTDNDPAAGVNYYRLKSLGLDGKTIYSEIKSLIFDSKLITLISPNPARSFVNIQFAKESTELVNVEIYDLNGKLVHRENTNSKNLKLNISNFAKGTYVLKIRQGIAVEIQKLVVQ